MRKLKDQHNVGTPVKLRGQQTGFAGNPDKNREAMEDTPAVSGRRKTANKMAADKSSQHVASDSSSPSTNAPSTPAMTPATLKGESGGEKVFKQRLAKNRKA